MTAKKNPHAAALGKLGGFARMKQLSHAEKAKPGRKGGKARSAKLSAAQRSRIAKLAVAGRERRRREERKTNHGQA
jgi:hypothetical protein